MASVIALDIDLQRVHGWSTTSQRVCYKATEPPWEALAAHDTILIEVASPTFYAGKDRRSAKGAASTVRWMLFNIGTASAIAARFPDKVVVAPSSVWTQGHPEEVRHRMAHVEGQDNHDLRECRAMLYFYRLSPSRWVPFNSYLRSL